MSDPGMSYLNFLMGSQIDMELAQARERIREIRANAAQKKAAGCLGPAGGATGSDGGHYSQQHSTHDANQTGD